MIIYMVVHCVENKGSISLDSVLTMFYSTIMQSGVKPRKTLVAVRPNESDLKLLAKLRKKLGVGESQLIRLGLRALAEKEGMTA